MKPSRKDSAPLSRRRFVGMLAAGTAAIIAPGGAVAAVTAAAKRPARPAAAAAPATMSAADRKEYARQVASTKSTLEVIRKHKMPPGTELASIFKPLRPRRGNG